MSAEGPKKRRGLFDAPFNDGVESDASTPVVDERAEQPAPRDRGDDDKEPTDEEVRAREALFLPRENEDTIEQAYAHDLAIQLLAGCLKRPILFEGLRALPDAKGLLPSPTLGRAFDVMCALADIGPVTPRSFAAHARQVGNETDDDALDAITARIMRAPSGTRSDLEELIGRAQRLRLASLGDRLSRFGRADHARHQVSQCIAEAEVELGAISALGKGASPASIAVPLPPRTRPFRDPARWSSTIPALDASTGGGIAPLSLWTVRGEGSGALCLQVGLGLACLGLVPTRLISTRRSSDALSALFDRFVGERGRVREPPLSLQPAGAIAADGLIEEITRAAQGGDRLIVVEGLERVQKFSVLHAEALARLPQEEECTLVLAGRAAAALEEVYFELQTMGDVHLELTPFGAEGAVFAECSLADAATPTSARLPTGKDGLFEGRRPRR